MIARRGVSSTFTIRKVFWRGRVERTSRFAPTIDHIEVVTKGDVPPRQALLPRSLAAAKIMNTAPARPS